MAETLLATVGLHKQFGAIQATDNLTLEVRAGEVHAVIGPNGAGKTTLVAQLFGELAPDSGTILFRNEDITGEPVWGRTHRGMARSYQISSVYPDFTAEDNVAMAVQAVAGHSFHFFRNARCDPNLRQPARAALERVNLLDRAGMLVRNLAHGERRQLELAMALASNPSFLLLDEPMAGMSQQESRKVLEVLSALKGKVTMLLVEHDMEVVFALADRITVLVYGRAIATGKPEEIRANAAVREAYLGT